MKWQLLYYLSALIVLQACSLKNPSAVADAGVDKAVNDTIHFASHIQPIFVKNCSPCHFTGGKMYEKLPFDQDTTIIRHGEAILKRIKDEKENNVLKKFLEQVAR